jgi:hypothetical protein
MRPRVEPRILASALKHGVLVDDIRHALDLPMRLYALDDNELVVIGPARNGELLEIVLADPEDDARVIHAMPARRRFIRYLEGREKP